MYRGTSRQPSAQEAAAANAAFLQAHPYEGGSFVAFGDMFAHRMPAQRVRLLSRCAESADEGLPRFEDWVSY